MSKKLITGLILVTAVFAFFIVSSQSFEARAESTSLPCVTNWRTVVKGTYSHPATRVFSRDEPVGRTPPMDVIGEGGLNRLPFVIRSGSFRALKRALTNGCDMKIMQQGTHFSRTFYCQMSDWASDQVTCETGEVAVNGSQRQFWSFSLGPDSVQIGRYVAPVPSPGGVTNQTDAVMEAYLWSEREGTNMLAEEGTPVTVTVFTRR